MKRAWQATAAALVLVMASAAAAEDEKTFTWAPPKVGPGLFTRDLGMLDSEREDYATNLAVYAINKVAAAKASPASLEEARKILALSLHLSPRNRKALVATFQLGKGVLPEAASGEYSPQVLARLLVTRGQLLQKEGGEENVGLARMFIELGAGMDPKNEEAVYASEMLRLDHGAVDWNVVMDFKGRGKSSGAEAPAPQPQPERKPQPSPGIPAAPKL